MVPDPAHAHPSWCDRNVCSHPDSLQARGLTEADVPGHLRDVHLGTPRTVDTGAAGEVRLTLTPWRFVNEAVTDEVMGIDLVIESRIQLLTVGVMVAPAQTPALVEAFAAVRDVAAGTTLADEAIRDLGQFPGADRYIVSSLLPLWRRHAELSDADIVTVLDAFTRPGE